MPRRIRPWPGISEEAETLAYAIRSGTLSLGDLLMLAERERWVGPAFEELCLAGVVEVNADPAGWIL